MGPDYFHANSPHKFAPHSYCHYESSLLRDALLSACSRRFLVTFAVKGGYNLFLSLSRVMGVLQDPVSGQVKFWLRTDCIHEDREVTRLEWK